MPGMNPRPTRFEMRGGFGAGFCGSHPFRAATLRCLRGKDGAPWICASAHRRNLCGPHARKRIGLIVVLPYPTTHNLWL